MKTLKFILFVTLLAVVPFLNLQAQCGKCGDAMQWTLSRSWSNGFNALPDVCTNLKGFQVQYQKNQPQWDAMFKWLATHDLQSIPFGRHPIEGTSLVVSVEDSENQPLAKRASESHYHHIDFQYIVKGSERFGLLDHASSKPNCEYRPDVIHYDYDVDKAMFIDSTPERFFLLFPGDWHIAKVCTDKPSQTIRVIVIKLDYVE
ncbi:MAG: YhcH/YjgK/YiaL family protein [Bacteroides sp.]|nr:YhcH/YjgK/YiaL family protein [Bacteroides sp.]